MTEPTNLEELSALYEAGTPGEWVCLCGNAPCDGLDCGVWLPGRNPRKRASRSPDALALDRRKAWETRREKYGVNGHG